MSSTSRARRTSSGSIRMSTARTWGAATGRRARQSRRSRPAFHLEHGLYGKVSGSRMATSTVTRFRLASRLRLTSVFRSRLLSTSLSNLRRLFSDLPVSRLDFSCLKFCSCVWSQALRSCLNTLLFFNHLVIGACAMFAQCFAI
jgi:hypothetical protein